MSSSKSTDLTNSVSNDGGAPGELPRFEPYQSPASGWGALQATARALREQSVVGFDCPGCAWPDPEHTSSFEFCENGAKAAAFELTSRRVTRDFFAAHAVRELEQQSDYWLEEQGRLTEPMRVLNAWEDAFAITFRAVVSRRSMAGRGWTDSDWSA
jgi:anaerobic selenocysteine-containing dehydrogenase